MDTTAPELAPLNEKPSSLFNRLLINRNHALLWAGLGISRIGDIIFITAMLLWVATTLARNAPWAAFAVGALTFLPQIVSFAFGTVAGVFVDRWNKRQTQLWADGLRTLLTLLLVLVTGVVPLPFPAGSDAAALFQLICLFVIIALISICSPFVNAALIALLCDIVDQADLPRAFGRAQVIGNIGIILAPPLAAAIFFTVGVQWTILLDALSFAVSFLAIFAIRQSPQAEPAPEAGQASATKANFLKELLEGLRFVGGNSVLVAMGLSVVLTTMGIGALTILGIFFVTNNLYSPPQFYPLLDVAFGVGAMVGAFVGPWLRAKLGLLRTFWIPGLATGLLVVILSRLTNIWGGIVLMFLIGISESILVVVLAPLALQVTPRELVGRTNALLGQLTTLASMISIVIAAFLIATPLHNKHVQLAGLQFSSIDTLFLAAGILIITSGLCSMVTLNHYIAVEEHKVTEDKPRTRRRQIAISASGLLLAIALILGVTFAAPPAQRLLAPQLAQGAPASGQPVDGLQCLPAVGTKTHITVHLSIYMNDQPLAIPAGIGIVAPRQPGVAALASQGKTSCLYPLHVYENDNIIHVESADGRVGNLGQFFALWGQPLNATQVLGYPIDGSQNMVVQGFDANGNALPLQHNNAGAIPLFEHETIYILLNSPHVQITPFTDWNGL